MGIFSRIRGAFSRPKKTTTIKQVSQTSPTSSSTSTANFQPAPTGDFTPAPTTESTTTFVSGGGGGSSSEPTFTRASPSDLAQQTLAPTQTIPADTLVGRATQAGVSTDIQRVRERRLAVETQKQAQEQEIVGRKDFDRRFKELEARSIGGQTLRTGESEFFLRPEQDLFTPKPEVKTTRQKIAEVGRTFVDPLGTRTGTGKFTSTSSGLIIPRQRVEEARERQPIRTKIALDLPSPTEIIAFSTIGELTPIVRGEALIKRTKNPRVFRADVVAKSKDPLGRGKAITLGRGAVADVKGGTVGIGVAGTVSKTSKGIETVVSKLAGTSKGTGTAKLVTTIPKTGATTSKVVGKGFVSDTVVKDIARITTRKGLRLGLPQIEKVAVKGVARRQRITGLIKQGQADDVATFVGTPRIRPLKPRGVLKPRGLVARQRGRLDTPDIKIDIGLGKFPSDRGASAKFIKKTGSIGGAGGQSTRQVPRLTTQIGDGVTKTIAQTSAKAIDALKPQVAKSIARQSAGRQSLGLAKVKTPTLRTKATQRAIAPQISTPRLKNIPTTATSTRQFVGGTTRAGQIPRSALRGSQEQRTRQELKTRQETRQQPLLKITQIPRQQQRFRLKLRTRQKFTPRIPRISIPNIPRNPPETPFVPFGKLAIPTVRGKKGKKKRARDDFGFSETFVQRQLLLDLPKGLGRLPR